MFEHDDSVPAHTPVPRALNAALGVGALLGAACIVFGICAMIFSLTPLVFSSGSMAPAIPTGSLAVGRDVTATDIRVGDVVSVQRDDGSRITHRVESAQSTADSAVLVLKGDANDTADADPYTVTSATKVIVDVPYLGYVAAWSKTPFALVVGAIVGVALVYLIFRPDPTRRTATEGRHRATSAVLTIAVAAAVLPGFAGVRSTMAAMNDTATANATVRAATLARPSTFQCAGDLLTSRLSWTSPNPAYGHRLEWRNNTTNVLVATQNYDAGVSSTGPPVQTALALLNTYNVRLYSRVGNFVSTGYLVWTVNVTLGLGGVILSSCVRAGAPVPNTAARSAQPEAVPATTTGTSTTTGPSVSTGAPTSTESPTTSTSGTTTTSSATTSTATTSTTTTSTTTTSTTTSLTTTSLTTTPPPPPASAFIADGSSRTSGDATASVTGGELTITDASGTTVFQRSVSRTDRYGTGVTWSDDGNLYILSEGSPVRVVASADGSFTASTVTAAALPSDIAALI